MGIPVPVTYFSRFNSIKQQRKLVEKRHIADDIHIRMLFTVFSAAPSDICGFWAAGHQKGDLMFKILPLIRHGVVTYAPGPR